MTMKHTTIPTETYHNTLTIPSPSDHISYHDCSGWWDITRLGSWKVMILVCHNVWQAIHSNVLQVRRKWYFITWPAVYCASMHSYIVCIPLHLCFALLGDITRLEIHTTWNLVQVFFELDCCFSIYSHPECQSSSKIVHSRPPQTACNLDRWRVHCTGSAYWHFGLGPDSRLPCIAEDNVQKNAARHSIWTGHDRWIWLMTMQPFHNAFRIYTWL